MIFREPSLQFLPVPLITGRLTMKIDFDAAILEVESRWGAGVAIYLGCESASIDRDSSKELDWGWVFRFVAGDNDSKRSECFVAFDKTTKKIAPVGTKGLEFAISLICD